jgi:hypothetical protein
MKPMQLLRKATDNEHRSIVSTTAAMIRGCYDRVSVEFGVVLACKARK